MAITDDERAGDERDDATLLTAHAGGDSSAFPVLVARHRDRAWAVALRTLGDPTEAADAVQDAFIKVHRTAHNFRGEAAVSTWLHRVVVNTCLDRMRRAKVRATAPLDDAMLATLADPHDAIGERELARDITAALAELPEDQRVAIVLVDLEGWAVEEVAEFLDVPTGTVKSRCHRGRIRLALLLGHLRPRPGTPPASTASDPRDPNPTTRER